MAGPATREGTDPTHSLPADPGDPAEPGDAGGISRRRAGIAVAGLALASAVLAVVAARVLYPMFSPDLDDVAYFNQAGLLAHGRLTLPASDATFFRPYLTGISGDRIVFVYTPLWAGILAASRLAFGTPLAALPAVAAAGVATMYAFGRELFRESRLIPLVAAGIFALSPMAALLSGTYLSYHVGAVIALAAGWLLLRGLRTRGRWSLAGAGAAFAAAFFGRPYDAILLALPFAVYAILIHRRRWRDLVAPTGWLVAGALPLLAVTFVVNAHLMGSPWSFPQNVAGSYNRFGFGPRRLFVESAADVSAEQVFTLGRSVHATWINLLWSPRWVFGSVISMAAAAFAAVRWRRDGRAWLLVALATIYPLGYLFWWGSYNATVTYRITRQLGPFYYHPALAAVALLAAWGLVTLLQQRPAVVVAAVAALGTVLVAVGVVGPLRDTFVMRDLRRSQEAMVLGPVPDHDALVFLPGAWLLNPFPTLANPPGRTGPRVFAIDRADVNLELMDRYPGRDPWVVHSAYPADANIFEVPEAFTVHHLRVRSASTLVRSATLTVRTLHPHAMAYARSGRHTRWVSLPPAPGGRHRVAVTFRAPPGTASGAGHEVGDGRAVVDPDGTVHLELTVPVAPGHATMAFGVGFGPTTDLGTAARFEYRYAYRARGDGTMTYVDFARPYRQVVFPGHDPSWISQQLGDVVRLEGA